MERKLLTELSINPETFPTDSDELSALVWNSAQSNTSGRHRISRVVVLHNDKLETFHADAVYQKEKLHDDFFDNDSFWSGSITWY